MSTEPKPIGSYQKRAQTFDTGAAVDRLWRLAKEHTVQQKDTYTYDKMVISYHDQIRILRILAGKKTDPLECMLFPRGRGAQTSDIYNYTALSYWWGDPDEIASHPIKLYDDTGVREGLTLRMSPFNSSGTFHVRKNLNAALRQFRKEKEDVNVWVDALCINQRNLVEKTAQVLRMDEVYSEASSVCVWLGSGNLKTIETFQFLRDILDLRKLDELVQSRETPEKWMMVIKLMKNRWFSRRWVIQELALAKFAYVRWGGEMMLWSDFAEAIALFMTKIDDIKGMLRDPALFPNKSDPDADIGELDPHVLGANALVAATSNLFRKSEDGTVQQRLVSLEVLVSSIFLAFEASEPKDTIYAVLSLAKDTVTKNSLTYTESWKSNIEEAPALGFFGWLWYLLLFKWLWSDAYQRVEQEDTPEPSSDIDTRIAPDYDKSLADVCADFMEYCIDKSQSLDIMCRHWAPEPRKLTPLEKLDLDKTGRKEVQERMPSWIPSIKGHSHGGPLEILHGRRNGDSFVGSAERPNQRHYNASGGLRPYFQFGKCKASVSSKDQGVKANRTSPVGLDENPPTEPTATKTPRVAVKKFDGTLYVRGFKLQTIDKISGRVLEGIIPKDAMEFAGWPNADEKVPDLFWRTLVGDRGPDGTTAPAWYRRACLECLSYINASGDLNTNKVRNLENTPVTMKAYLERVQNVVWCRKFFLTKPGSGKPARPPMFGLAPDKANVGDLLCILYGCSVPVVLRRLPHGQYQFIGECYVHGMMDGEALPANPPKYPYGRSMKDGFTIV